MADNKVQLPPGYKDAVPADPASGVLLPPGYEDAKPVSNVRPIYHGEVMGSKVPDSILNAPDSLGDAVAGITGAGAAAMGLAEGAGRTVGPVLAKIVGKLPVEGATDYAGQAGTGILGLMARHPEVIKAAKTLGVPAAGLAGYLLGEKK